MRRWLVDEIDVWQSEEILSAGQSARLLDLYELQTEVADRKHSAALVALMSVAALLVGLAVLLLIGYNWQEMPSALKLVTIFGVITATHATGFYLRFRRGIGRLSEVAFFLGCLFYGAGIFLVAQIFHLNAHEPGLVWWWAVGVLPFALCLRTPLLHILFVALMALWGGMEVIGFSDLGAWLFGRWRHLPNAAYSLPLLALPGLAWAYRNRSVVTVGLYVPLIAWWAILQPFAWQPGGGGEDTVYFIGAVGGLLFVFAESHTVGSRFAIPFRVWGMLIVAGLLLPLSFYDFNEHVMDDARNLGGLILPSVILLTAVVSIVLAAFAQREVERETVLFADRLRRIMQRQWLPLGLVLLMAFLALWNAIIHEPLLPTIAVNVAMVAVSFWLMRVGLRDDRSQPFVVGVMYFLLWTVLRYIDLFGDFGGMVGAALMFFLCGAALFGVALLWRRRKETGHA